MDTLDELYWDKGKRFQHENAFILVPLGTLASPTLLLSFILKRVLFMHQPFLFFVITLCDLLHKKH